MIVGTVVSLLALNWNYRDRKAKKALEEKRLLDEAWDLIGGSEGSYIVESLSGHDQLILAKRKINDALIVNPNSKYAFYFLGIIAEAKKDFLAAEKYYWNSIEKSGPRPSGAYDALGRMFIKLGRYDDAEFVYLKALRAEDSEVVQYSLGLICLHKKNFSDGIERFKHALWINPEYKEAHANLVAVYCLSGDYESATKAFCEANSLRKADRSCYENASTAYRMLGEVDRANTLLETAKTLGESDSNSEVWFRLQHEENSNKC